MNNYQNLNVPFNVPIPGGMHSGKMITVQGSTPPMSQRFAINLLCKSGDIALHVCPRFRENRVVRNNVCNMNWGPEESIGSLPIKPGQSFELVILCELYDFKIAFNGYHFTEFNHRVPYNSISNLAVDGEVVVHNVSFREQNNYSNTNTNSSLPYGFQPSIPITNNNNSGGLYPSISPYPPKPSSGHPPNAVPPYPSSTPLYPTQPNYGNIPHQGPYPQAPSPQPGGGGYTPTPNTKPGFLDQAGTALAGLMGTGLLAGGIDRLSRQNTPQGNPNILDHAGRALAGVFGGPGVAGSGKPSNKTQSNTGSRGGFLDQAGSALVGVLGGTGLAGTGRPYGRSHSFSGSRGGYLDDAGSALAGILGGSGLAGNTGSPRGRTPPHTGSRSFLDDAGSALAGVIGGSGLAGNTGSSRGRTPPYTGNRSFLDDAGYALAGVLGGSGLSGNSGHGNRKKLGVLGGTLGTAVAGAALTGHLNPIKAAKKQRKAQKKALKYGLPIAGAGLGAYAIHKGLKGFRRSSSSSSSSSD